MAAMSLTPARPAAQPGEVEQLARDLCTLGGEIDTPRKYWFGHRTVEPKELPSQLGQIPLRMRLPGLPHWFPLASVEELSNAAAFGGALPLTEGMQPFQTVARAGWRFHDPQGSEVGAYGAFAGHGAEIRLGDLALSLKEVDLGRMAAFYEKADPLAQAEAQGYQFFDARGKRCAAFQVPAKVGREGAPWLDARQVGDLPRVAPLVTGNPSALPLALELLKGPMAADRAGQLLREMGPETRSRVMPGLLAQLDHIEPYQRMRIGYALNDPKDDALQTQFLQWVGTPTAVTTLRLRQEVQSPRLRMALYRAGTDPQFYLSRGSDVISLAWRCRAGREEFHPEEASELGPVLHRELLRFDSTRALGEKIEQWQPTDWKKMLESLRWYREDEKYCLPSIGLQASSGDPAMRRRVLESFQGDERHGYQASIALELFDLAGDKRSKLAISSTLFQRDTFLSPEGFLSLAGACNRLEVEADREPLVFACLEHARRDPSRTELIDALKRWKPVALEQPLRILCEQRDKQRSLTVFAKDALRGQPTEVKLRALDELGATAAADLIRRNPGALWEGKAFEIASEYPRCQDDILMHLLYAHCAGGRARNDFEREQELWTGRLPAKNDTSVMDSWVLERLKDEPAAATVMTWHPRDPHLAASTLLKLAHPHEQELPSQADQTRLLESWGDVGKTALALQKLVEKDEDRALICRSAQRARDSASLGRELAPYLRGQTRDVIRVMEPLIAMQGGERDRIEQARVWVEASPRDFQVARHALDYFRRSDNRGVREHAQVCLSRGDAAAWDKRYDAYRKGLEGLVKMLDAEEEAKAVHEAVAAPSGAAVQVENGMVKLGGVVLRRARNS